MSTPYIIYCNMFADEYLNGVIYSSIGNVLAMILVERDSEKSCIGANSDIVTEKSSTNFKLKYHLTINVRFFFTVVLLCHPGFSTKCDSLHH